MGLTILETGQVERARETYDVTSHPAETHGDITPTPKGDRQVQLWSEQDDTEKIGLRTLGDGPLAPGAAGEAAQAEAEQEEDDKDVNPGTKGWLNLLGVNSCL